MTARTRRCVHTRMPEARNGSRLLVEQPRMCPLLFTVYTRLPVRPYTRTEKNMRIKIETIQSDVCVYSVYLRSFEN